MSSDFIFAHENHYKVFYCLLHRICT